MSTQGIMAIINLVLDVRQSRDAVKVSIEATEHGRALAILEAPSYVLDAITDNGYFLKVCNGKTYVDTDGVVDYAA